MSTQFAIQTVIEIILLAAVVLSFLEEGRLIALEEKIASKLRRRKKSKKVYILRTEKHGAHCA